MRYRYLPLGEKLTGLRQKAVFSYSENRNALFARTLTEIFSSALCSETRRTFRFDLPSLPCPARNSHQSYFHARFILSHFTLTRPGQRLRSPHSGRDIAKLFRERVYWNFSMQFDSRERLIRVYLSAGRPVH